MSMDGHGIPPSGGRRFYTYTEDDERHWLEAETLDDAIEECRDGDHTVLGQTVDIYDSHEEHEEEAVASCVDVEG